MKRQIQSSFLWIFAILAGVTVFGLEAENGENNRITYTDTDNDMSIEWFGLTLEETPAYLSKSAIDSVVNAVNLMAKDEMFKIYDNTDYMFDGITLETVMDPETLVLSPSASQRSKGNLRRVFELDQHAGSRDLEVEENSAELPPKRKIRRLAKESEGEYDEYLKRTRQVIEETYGTYLVLGGNFTFMQLPTPLADDINYHLKTILSNTDQMMQYIESFNIPELSNILNKITVTMPLASSIPTMLPSKSPSNTLPPNSPPTPTSSLTSEPTLSPTPAESPNSFPSPGGGDQDGTTSAPTSPSFNITQGIKNTNPEQPGADGRSRNILIVAVASCSAALIALSSAFLVRRRFASEHPELEYKGEGYSDFDNGGKNRKNEGNFSKSDELNSSFESSEMARSGITRINTDSTPKASGRTSRNPYTSPDHSYNYANNSSDYYTAGSSNTSFSYSAGMQMREAELEAQNRNTSGIMVDPIDEGYPSPPLSSASSPQSNYHPARDEFEDHAIMNGQTIIHHGPANGKNKMSPSDNYTHNIVGISPTSEGIEVAALPTGSNSPRIMASWGSWLFGSNNKDSNNKNDNNSNQKSNQEKDVGAFPRATEEDFFQAEFPDSHEAVKKSSSRKPSPRLLEQSYLGDTSRSKTEENFQSFSDGSFPIFGMEDHAPPMRSASTRSHFSKNASSAAESSSREDSSSAAYTMNDLHPLDWSNKGSENGDDDSSLTEHDGHGPTDAEGQRIYKQYLEKERRRRGGTPSRHTSQDYPNTPQSESSAYFSVQSEQSDVSHASSSKQLINDLVWLEKKISDVRARVDRLDGDEVDSSSSVDSFMASNASSRSSVGGEKSPISQSIICRDCFAPPGRLQIIIHSTRDGPSVHSVKPGSSLEGKLFPGDLILAVDDTDTRRLSAEDVMKMMAAKSAYERKITVLHFDDRSFQM